jgi:tripartite ATP-independent transporter DctM subunit
MGALLLVLLFSFIVIRVPIAFSLGLAALVYTLIRGIDISMLIQRMVIGTDSWPLLAIPFFILAGETMNTGGVTSRLIKMSKAFVGHIRGGLGHVNVVASMIFAGMSGAAVADASALGTVLIPAMKKEERLPGAYAAAIVAAASTIGPIIPPSIPMVIYGLMAGVSVGNLFLGGFVPGFLMGGSLMVMIYIIARKRGYPAEKRASFKEMLLALQQGFFPLIMPLIILGGIIFGVFTPTEAAAVAVTYGMIVGGFIYRELKWKDLPGILLRSALQTSVVMIIIAFASYFGWLMALEQIPSLAAQFIAGFSRSPLVILVLINIFLLFVGMVMETLAAMLILIPVLVPITTALGISPLHFGLIMVLNLMIGLLTPPVAMCLYVVTGISGEPFEKIASETVPFLIPLLVVLALITVFPELVMFVPRLVMGSVS